MENATKPKSFPYDRVLGGPSAGGTYDEYALDPMRAGELLAVESITLLNESNGATSYSILVGTYGNEKEIIRGGTLTANTPALSSNPFYVRDNERVLVRITGATAADKQTIVIRGEVQYAGPQAVRLEVNG